MFNVSKRKKIIFKYFLDIQIYKHKKKSLEDSKVNILLFE